ncbi:MAG: hypothetical protein ACFBWO_13965 [Paracoccaceae bacterium]
MRTMFAILPGPGLLGTPAFAQTADEENGSPSEGASAGEAPSEPADAANDRADDDTPSGEALDDFKTTAPEDDPDGMNVENPLTGDDETRNRARAGGRLRHAQRTAHSRRRLSPAIP